MKNSSKSDSKGMPESKLKELYKNIRELREYLPWEKRLMLDLKMLWEQKIVPKLIFVPLYIYGFIIGANSQEKKRKKRHLTLVK